jgi:3-oxoacyl-[acyl-carrier protein] reductase
MILDFTGQTVLVTGATKGIGAAIASAFENSGASLILTGTDEKQIDNLNRSAQQQRKDHIRWLQADFSSANTTSSFIKTIAQISPIHVLINNAGTNRINTIDNILEEDLDLLLSINLRAPILICNAISHTMKRMNYGRIVNIASIWSTITKPGRTVYTATKSGLAGMTKNVAIDLAPYNILVNAVSPGFTNTELTRASLSLEEHENIANQVPLGRFAEPEEIAKTVLFLSSNWNTYITGQNIVIDGGYASV